jgi:drug/metabolite transporter (DMT)-like permease
MLSTTPAVLAILSIIFLKERISGKIVVAIIMCVIGLLFINVTFGSERLPFDLMQLVGSLSIFISVISEALFTIFRKKQSFSTKPLTTTVFVMLFAFVLFLPVGLYQLHDYPFPMIRTNEWVAMIYYGVMCSALAYTCWFSGLARVKVGEAATMTGLLPVSSVLLSVIILGESVGVNQLIGMGFILIGIYVIMMKSRSKLDIAVSG